MCVQIAEAIKGDQKLTLLDLGGNNIGSDGVAAISAALKGHTALKTLDLASNPIGDAGARALADVLKYDLAVTPMLITANVSWSAYLETGRGSTPGTCTSVCWVFAV